ncbi:acyl-CoA dehydrogenase family protein [Nocardioides hungaricus]
MDFELADQADRLRSRLRALMADHVPTGYLGAFSDDPADLEVAQAFCRLLAAEGLLTLAWPHEYGGRDGSVWEQTVVREEMWANHEPRGAQYMGVNWVGPVLMRHGTPEQRRKHLPPIGAGEVVWCQGFSEPDAGSDLASLRTSATRKPEGGWVISGQKVWTSYAEMAQWCFLLARTGDRSSRHDGITVFLVPMDSPGLEVRPIRSMIGPHHLNEVFFDSVEVGDDAVLGAPGEGWNIVREVLAYERVGIARYARCEKLLQWAPRGVASWDAVPGTLKVRWARELARTRAVRLLAYKVLDAQSGGRANPAETAAYRTAATLLDQSVADLLLDIVGADLLGHVEDDEDFLRAVEDHWRYAQAATVASGTLEMQKNLIGREMATGRG